MVVEIVYVAVCSLLLPFFMLGQEYDGRQYPFIAVSALYGLWLLTGGYAMPYDVITQAVLAIALWWTASLIWSKTHQSQLELLNCFSYLLLFSAARTLPVELALYAVLPVGTILAFLQLYRQVFKYKNPFPIFGNRVHNAAFILPSMMAGVWLSIIAPTVEAAGLLALLAIFSGLAVITSKSKGSILAMLSGCSVIGIWLMDVYLLIGIMSVVVFVLVIFFRNKEKNWNFYNIRGSYNERFLIFVSALCMIKKSFFIGHGLRMFRKLMPETIINFIAKNKYIASKILNKKTSVPRNIIFSNRVHNDILELWVELGIVGVFLFIYLFMQIRLDALSTGFLVMAGVCGMTFFFLGVNHTAIPFWIVMGSVAGIANSSVGGTWVLKAVGFVICLYAIWNVLRKFLGYMYFSQAFLSNDNNKKIKLLREALHKDSDNGDYLFLHSYYTFESHPHEALYSLMKAITHYDGNRVIWGLWDNLSRLVFTLDKIKISKWANSMALKYNSVHATSLEMKKIIEQKEVFLAKVVEALTKKNKVKK